MFFSKQTKTIAAMALLSVSRMSAQAPTPAAPQAPTPVERDTIRKPTVRQSTSGTSLIEKTNYIRRFSIGGTLSVMALDTLKNNTTSQFVTNSIDAIYNTTAVLKRIGYGATVQLAITNKLAVTAGFHMKKTGYTMNSDVFSGIDNPLTISDDRKHTITNETTNARYYDLPVTGRFYFKGRQDRGPHWFVEGGGVIRKVAKISTSINTTIGTGDTSCCNTNPIKPHKLNTTGMIGGLGVQLVDPVGLRIVPSVRYTRFLDTPFNSFSTVNKRNQIEAMITIGF